MSRRYKVYRWLFIVAIAFILALCILSYLRLNALTKSGQLVNHTNLVKLRLQKIVSSLNNAESNQRGFLITNDSSFLTLKETALRLMQNDLESLDLLIDDNPAQEKNALVLKAEITQRVSTLNSVLNNYTPLVINADLKNEMRIGNNAMEKVRHRILIMTQSEDDLLAQRMQNYEKQLKVAPASLFIFSVVSLFVLFISFYLLNQALHIAQRLQISENQLELIIRERTEQLRQTNAELERTNKELSSFAHVTSHDLQEPLRKIQMFVQLLKENETAALSKQGKHYFSRVENASRRMQQLILDLLAYSQTSGEVKYFEKTDLNVVLQQVKADLKEKLEANKVTILAGKLPEAKIIPFQFQQLFTNLISNSIKFSKPGVHAQISISSSIVDGTEIKEAKGVTAGNYHHITFSDNGIGFDATYNEQIFKLFQRLHGSGEYEGTGIGLSIVKKITDNHNGFITAYGEPGKGATFNIYIPAS